MKIGIITHPLSDNYGGILQAVSLYAYLKSKGHHVVILRRHINRPLWKKIIISILENIPFQNIKNYRYLAKKRVRQENFIEKNLPSKTKIIYKKKELVDLVKDFDFDAVIVGSDQVWRMKYIDDGDFGNYFLDFVESPKIKKIAYAASFGSNRWEAPEKISIVKKLLREFDAVSVREASGVEICREVFGRMDCVHTLDPTLLVGKHFHDSLIENKDYPNKRKIFTYILDKTNKKGEIFKGISFLLERNYGSVIQDSDLDKILTVDEWISEIKNADFVITDSYHGMVFSIIFEKKFIAIGNASRGMARFDSLASMLNVSDRVIVNKGQIGDHLFSEIDYSIVNKRLIENRKFSEEFLTKSLS